MCVVIEQLVDNAVEILYNEEQRKTCGQKRCACCLWMDGGKALQKWNFSTHLMRNLAKSGSDEGLWAETSAIYINYQHLCGLHKRE